MEELVNRLSAYIALIRDNRDLLIMCVGIAASVYIYNDFRAVVQAQADTASKTAEILRVMQQDISTLRTEVSNLQR